MQLLLVGDGAEEMVVWEPPPAGGFSGRALVRSAETVDAEAIALTMFTSQLAEQEALNGPSLEKASEGYSATLRSSTGAGAYQFDRPAS
jgi:hypothetical protein